MNFIKRHFFKIIFSLIITSLIGGGIYFYLKYQNTKKTLQSQLQSEKNEKKSLTKTFEKTKSELTEMKNRDEYKINEELKTEIDNIESTFETTVDAYENMVDLKPKVKDTAKLEKLFAATLSYISEFNYASASASLEKLNSQITKIEQELAQAAAVQKIPADVPESSTPPGSGYSRQKVTTSAGTFLVSIISADLSSTRVIVDTAAESDCSNNCPVKSLAEYVSENGAYAGVNGTYFCPEDYPSCAGKTNTFDLLVMNKNKTYFNSDNNVYSNNPAVIFGDNYIRFVSSASQWGRDTSVNGVISNFPLLVFNNQVVFSGDGDPKKGSKGNRSFVANQENKVYIGVVHNVTVAESALVMKALGMQNAMNLDNGGSTALWHGGYKVGPGRSLPNVILFLR